MSGGRIEIRGNGKVPPEVIAAITAVLTARTRGEETPPARSAWTQGVRPRKSWHQNGKRHWRDGLRR
jgi:hypothetical protein